MLPHFSDGLGKPFGDFSWLAVYRGRSGPVARQARHDKSPNISSPCRAPRKVPSGFPKFLKLVVKSSFRLGGNRKRSAGALPEYKIPPHFHRISLSLLRDLRELERSGCEKFFRAHPVNGKIKNLNRRPQRPRRECGGIFYSGGSMTWRTRIDRFLLPTTATQERTSPLI